MGVTEILTDISQHILTNVETYTHVFIGWSWLATVQAWLAPGLQAKGWSRGRGLRWIWFEFKWSMYYVPHISLIIAGLYYAGIVSKLLAFQIAAYFGQFFWICYILPLPVYGADSEFILKPVLGVDGPNLRTAEKFFMGVLTAGIGHLLALAARDTQLRIAGLKA